jgi:hypothetical protein
VAQNRGVWGMGLSGPLARRGVTENHPQPAEDHKLRSPVLVPSHIDARCKIA